MTELQSRLLEMLEIFHRLCVEAGLSYYVLGGTALGAERHNGFIPWDDDVDVGLPRPDYERLKELTQARDMGVYRFEYPGEEKDFVYPYGKMYDTRTTLIENTRYQTKRGIYIDIFPLDGLGDNEENSLAHFRKIDRLVNLLCCKTCGIREGRKLYKNLAIRVIRCVPDGLLSAKKLALSIEAQSKKYAYEESQYVANCVGNWHEREIVRREWLGTPRLGKFQGIDVLCPENADAYLTAIYGNWRVVPPAEKQVSHHDYVMIDLHKPYKSV